LDLPSPSSIAESGIGNKANRHLITVAKLAGQEPCHQGRKEIFNVTEIFAGRITYAGDFCRLGETLNFELPPGLWLIEA
jgi:hypothetical protein